MTEFKQSPDKLKSNDEWGTYYMGKYYFTIATDAEKAEYGLTETNAQLSPNMQLKLQWQHFPALFHEFIHYIHELSTVIGNAGLALDLKLKSIFSHNFNPDLKSCENMGITPVQRNDVAILHVTQGRIMGDVYDVLQDGSFIEVTDIDYEKQELWFPEGMGFAKGEINVPIISFNYLKGKTVHNGKLYFGKYFIYEGLAYELDRQVEKQVLQKSDIDDNLRGTEYTVMRRIAQYVFPKAEKSTFLKLGSLALQYIHCGEAFILFLEKVKSDYEKGLTQEDSIRLMKEETQALLRTKREDFIGAQEEIKAIFKKRASLFKAFSFIAEKAILLYDERIKNPTFEVDHVIEGKHRDLVEIAGICDFMYLFSDKEEFMRDFFGTSLDVETSEALKVLLSYDHYYKAHNILSTLVLEQKQPVRCPFYYCCNLELRKTHSQLCAEKPWRVFELSANTDNMFCWYGSGVGEFKGHNQQ